MAALAHMKALLSVVIVEKELSGTAREGGVTQWRLTMVGSP